MILVEDIFIQLVAQLSAMTIRQFHSENQRPNRALIR